MVILADDLGNTDLRACGSAILTPQLDGLAGARGSQEHRFDGQETWATLADGASSPNEDILERVEPIRGAIRRGRGKPVKRAGLPGRPDRWSGSRSFAATRRSIGAATETGSRTAAAPSPAVGGIAAPPGDTGLDGLEA